MSDKLNALLAFGLTGILVLVHWLSGVIAFETNDDIGVIALLKGFFGFSPSAEGVFVSPLLGGLLYQGYQWQPSFPWFSAMLYAGMGLCCFVMMFTLLRTELGAGIKIASLTGATLFVAQLTLEISFTATALMLWATACAFLFQVLKRQEGWRWFHGAVVVQLAVAYLLRPSLLPIMLVFALPFLLFLRDRSRSLVLRIALPVLLVVIASAACGGWLRRGEYDRYEEFNRVRAEFTDTTRSSISANTRDALKAAGWSSDDYAVINNWWFHDGQVFSAEKIRQFLQTNAEPMAMFTLSGFKDVLGDYSAVTVLSLAWIALLAVPALRQNKGILLGLLFTTLFVALFFIMGVRFPRRVALPWFFMLFLYGPVLLGLPAYGRRMAMCVNVGAAIVAAALLLQAFPVFKEQVDLYPQRASIKQYIDLTVRAVAATHGQDMVLADVNPHILPLNYFPFQENDPVLQIPVLGTGWLVESPVYRDQLQRTGLGDRDTVVSAMIDNRRVVMRFWDSGYLRFNSYVRGAFLKHLRQHYQAADSGRRLDIKIINDFRQMGNGLVYFQLVTVPVS